MPSQFYFPTKLVILFSSLLPPDPWQLVFPRLALRRGMISWLDSTTCTHVSDTSIALGERQFCGARFNVDPVNKSAWCIIGAGGGKSPKHEGRPSRDITQCRMNRVPFRVSGRPTPCASQQIRPKLGTSLRWLPFGFPSTPSKAGPKMLRRLQVGFERSRTAGFGCSRASDWSLACAAWRASARAPGASHRMGRGRVWTLRPRL